MGITEDRLVGPGARQGFPEHVQHQLRVPEVWAELGSDWCRATERWI